jgi:hypothetical protein
MDSIILNSLLTEELISIVKKKVWKEDEVARLSFLFLVRQYFGSFNIFLVPVDLYSGLIAKAV